MMRLGEVARRLYTDLVRRRAIVRIVPEGSVRSEVTPRFILSPYRSGTTLLRYCLDSHPALACPPETDFLAPLGAVLSDEGSIEGVSDLGYSKDSLAVALGDMGRRFLDGYALSRGVVDWVDKSPRYAETPEILDQLFPDARYIILHRHPFDQIYSFTRNGTFVHPALDPGGSDASVIVRAAKYWASVTRNILAFQDAHGPACIAIKYEELCDQPETVLRRCLNHLRIPWDEAVLHHDRYRHDLGRAAGRVNGTVGFSWSGGAWSSWGEETKAAAWVHVGEHATRLGYSR